ncbi:MAG: hypothetical protein ACTHLW_09135 [Verrucomicrobiota bacterium]
MAEKEYIKFTPTRQRRGFAVVSSSRSCLWLGRDHLLVVSTDGFTETYKRFYFGDIQAIVLRRNLRDRVIGIVTGLMTAGFGLTALLMKAIEGKWVFGILAGVCAIPFVFNLLYGATCSCELRTAVQTEPLPPLSRVPRARKALARLRPLIAAAQGELSPEQAAVRMQEMISAPRTSTPEPIAPQAFAADDPNIPPQTVG